jgi:membrane protein YqaA with SNARE-associated domain
MISQPKEYIPVTHTSFEECSRQLLLQTASGHWFNIVCGMLALTCSLCALPVIPIIVSACLISPRRWRSLSFSIALGCALGAMVLVTLFHYFGWELVYHHFPEFLHYPAWQGLQGWISRYGPIGLLAIAASPLPEMPALIVLGVSNPDTAFIFLAVLSGKLIKYSLICWLSSRYPDRYARRVLDLLRKNQG